MTDVQTENKVAVFFDYENIVYSLRNRFEQKANFDALITKCKEFGRLTVAKAFADWGLPYMSPALMYALQSSGFELIFVPTGSTQANSPRKNVADLYMAISVMDTLYNRPEIDTFVLLTGDRDFMVLVNHLKENGKHVVAIGVDGSSSYYLTQAVDDFFYYSEVEEIFEDQPKRQKGRPTNIYDALQQAVQVMREKGRTPRLTNLKPIMVELMGSFDEKSYTDSKGRNFQKFKDFVQEAQRRGTVRLLRRGNTIEVHLPEENIDKVKRTKPSDDAVEDAIKLELAYKLLAKAVREVTKSGKSVRPGAVRSRIKKLLPSFNVVSIETSEGDFPFGKFKEFISAAEEANVIVLSSDNGRTEIALGSDSVDESEDDVTPVETEESSLNLVEGEEARAAILAAIRAYQNYPTSFLSLAGFVHRHNESTGISVSENEARDLMTEAVKGDLLHQIVLDDGRRQYELNDAATIVSAFLGQEDVAEVESIDDVAVEEEATEEAPVESEPAKFESPYDGLVEAIRTILQDGKDPVLPRVKSTMVNLMGSFSEKEYTDEAGTPFLKFKEFVMDAEKRGFVRLQVDGNINRVFLAEGAPEAASAEAPAAVSVEESTDADVDFADALADAAAEALAGVLDGENADQALQTEPEEDVSEAAPEPVVEEDQRAVGEPEQRALVVEGLRSFSSYPAPFMGILAHCRNLRNEQSVSITSADLRDLLSETVRIGLLASDADSDRRPTRYAFVENEALAQQYIDQDVVELETESEDAAPEADEAAVEAAAPESVEAVVEDAPAEAEAVVEEVTEAVSDAAIREVIAEVVASFDGYPAAYADILTAVQTAQAEKELGVTEKRLRDQLSAATRSKVLTITTPRGVRPTKYAYTSDEEALNSYLGKVTEPEAPVAVEAAEAVVDSAEPETAPAAVDTTGMPEEVVAFVEATQQLIAEGETTVLGNIKKRMKKLLKGFDEKKYTDAEGKPFKKFKNFVDEKVVALGVVELVKSGRTFAAELKAPSQADAEVAVTDEAAAVEDVTEAVAEAAEVESSAEEAVDETSTDEIPTEQPTVATLETANAALVQAVTQAIEAGGSLKLPGIKTRMEKIDASIDIKQLHDEDGKAFRGMGTFVRAAERAGLVTVTGTGMKIEVNLP